MVDAKTYEVEKYLLVGQRVWQMAFTPDQKYLLTTNGLSNDVSVIDVAGAEGGEVDPGRPAALGRGRRAEMSTPRSPIHARTTLNAASIVPALAVHAVSHAYGPRKALQDVSLSVPRARFTALLGLNGAGKTTLFSLITRLYDTQQGTDRRARPSASREQPGEALRRLGVVFQARTLDLDLSVMENLLYHAALHGIGGREARMRAAAALAEIDLADRGRDRCASCRAARCGGSRSPARCCIARGVLVLDEPTVGLDVASRNPRSCVTCARWCGNVASSVLWATHLLDEVAADDAVVVLHRGRVAARRRVADVVGAAGAADMRSRLHRADRRHAGEDAE